MPVLVPCVAQAQSVVERRNTIPILANVLIEAEGDTVSFRATDLVRPAEFDMFR